MKKFTLSLFLCCTLLNAEEDIFRNNTNETDLTNSFEHGKENNNLIPAKSDSLESFKEQENKEKAKQLMDLKALQSVYFSKNRKLQDNNFNVLYVAGNTNKIRLRYAMTTTFIFDNDPIIYVSLGDPSGFELIYPTNDHYDLSNMLVIKPLLIGVDTNLTVVGASGTIYTFYLFSTTYTSKFQSYFSVFVSNKRSIGKLNILSKSELEKREQEQLAKTETDNSNKQDKRKLDYRKINYESKEFDDGKFIRIGDEVNHIFIEKAKINRGYLQNPKHKRTWWSLWLYKKPSDDALDIKALDVFDDGKYTYFRYDRDQAFSKFPYTYKVVDGYDNPINSRVVGNYIIAEDVSKKWTLRSGKEYVCVRRDKRKYQKSKDFMLLKRLLEQDEAMKSKRNNMHLIEDTTPQPKNAISVTELLAQIKNQTPSKECRALNEEEVKTLEEVKNIIKAPKPLQKDLKNKLKKHTIKTHYCVPIPYIERLKTTDNLEKHQKGLNNTKKQNQANPIKGDKENKK
ncbi:TrbG/VirB9 family P-type conjugative transfer protein [Helicobacter pylori]|uniref:TrbG/VirB9 family P-type conjugative transfer protein n=1 Tax=Helicobacter pylori TaxID=210 RepID=UPI0013F3B305|nr:TrbG/VirB9 family P-type conjugative transfer protein [Helicobacter pylori]NHA47867.1 conjugal transfer protein [Helicobacter pylori]NHA73690.1 conjugal transfer protein [Helicobacter pylori]